MHESLPTAELSAQRSSFLGEAYTAASLAYKANETPYQWKDLTPRGDQPMAKEFKTADARLLQSPEGRTFVSFRGTTEMADWKANIGSAYGVSNKYDAAAAIGTHYRNDPSVAYTGHSLGGGLAKLAAAEASKGAAQDNGRPGGVTPKTVVAINAAPVSPMEYYRHDLGLTMGNADRVTINMVNRHDVLNRVVAGGDVSFRHGEALAGREVGVTPGALPDPGKAGTSVIVLAEGSGSAAGVKGHALKSFVPTTDLNGKPQFFVPLAASDGRPLQAQDFDKFYKLPSNDGRSAEILQRASSSVTIGQHRQQPAVAQEQGR